LKQTGEFALNLPTVKMLRAVDWCGVKSGRDFDKFKETGLTPLPAFAIGAPVVAESPLAIECRVKQIIPLGAHNMFLAEVAALNAAGKFIRPDGALDLAAAHPIAFMHGKYYAIGEQISFFGYSVEKKMSTRQKSAGLMARARKR
jgi:flavin reductase (DIM6/NTAB) family NADH-FMN oxidoreductase RutF